MLNSRTWKEIGLCESVGNEMIQRTLDQVQGSILCLTDNDFAIVKYLRGYKAKVNVDGICTLICEISKESEGASVELEEEEDVEFLDVKTYDLKITCLNCGNTWTQSIPFGMDFFPFCLGDSHWEAGWGQPAKYSGHRSIIGKQLIQCPSCGSYKADREEVAK